MKKAKKLPYTGETILDAFDHNHKASVKMAWEVFESGHVTSAAIIAWCGFSPDCCEGVHYSKADDRRNVAADLVIEMLESDDGFFDEVEAGEKRGFRAPLALRKFIGECRRKMLKEAPGSAVKRIEARWDAAEAKWNATH